MNFASPPPGGAIAPASDLAVLMAGERPDDGPKLLYRSDGQPLLYPAALNAIHAEPGAGKTWLALVGALAVSDAGAGVVYLDAESTALAMASRLVDLKAAPSSVDRLAYHTVEGALGAAEVNWLCDQVENCAVGLVVVDSLGEVLAAGGVDMNNDAETAKALASAFRPLARRGACVLLLDHVTKATDGRGRWAIGSQRKLAAIDGVAYSLEVVRPWARGCSGMAVLRVAKDRRGWVGPVGANAAGARFDSWPDGTLSVRLEAPVEGSEPVPGSVAHVVAALKNAGGCWESFADAVVCLEPLREGGARTALRQAVKQGAVVEGPGKGNLKCYRLPSAGEESIAGPIFPSTEGKDDDPEF